MDCGFESAAEGGDIVGLLEYQNRSASRWLTEQLDAVLRAYCNCLIRQDGWIAESRLAC
jgi:hypothetical protein